MLFNLQYINNIFNNYEGSIDCSVEIMHVNSDSRIKAANSLFIPLIGDRFDGHDYLGHAIDNGAVAALWQKDKMIPDKYKNTIPFFLVEDTLVALQELAGKYRKRCQSDCCGRDWFQWEDDNERFIESCSKSITGTHATIGNFNNNIGLPLTILQMNPKTEMLILEMGMNHFGEIEELAMLASPDFAIITNIGESHIEYLGSREGIAKAKLEITAGLKKKGTLIIDGDEPLLKAFISESDVITCGMDQENQLQIKDVSISEDETSFMIDDCQYHLPLLGVHQAKNASYVIALARKLQISKNSIQEGLNSLAHTGMRFEKIAGKNNSLLINDAYNASYTSMKAAIDVVKNLANYKTKVLILGDILELGTHSEYFHQQIGESISEPINHVFTFGESAKEITAVLNKEKSGITAAHFTNKSELIEALQPYLTQGSVLLFKASRMMKFEELVEACK